VPDGNRQPDVGRELEKDVPSRPADETALQKSETGCQKPSGCPSVAEFDGDCRYNYLVSRTIRDYASRALGEPTYEENLRLYHPESAELLHAVVQRTAHSRRKPYLLRLRVLREWFYAPCQKPEEQAGLNAEDKSFDCLVHPRHYLVQAEAELREIV